MMPVGATVVSPVRIISPTSPAKPPTSAARTGSSTSATSTETRFVMVSSRNRPIVKNPSAASIGVAHFLVYGSMRRGRVSKRGEVGVQHQTEIYPCRLRINVPCACLCSLAMENNLRQLAAYAAVARAKSFTAAAARLHVSQSSLSRAVADLERQLGTLLLERDTRNVQLTVAGVEALRIAEQIVNSHRSGMKELERFLLG